MSSHQSNRLWIFQRFFSRISKSQLCQTWFLRFSLFHIRAVDESVLKYSNILWAAWAHKINITKQSSVGCHEFLTTRNNAERFSSSRSVSAHGEARRSSDSKVDDLARCLTFRTTSADPRDRTWNVSERGRFTKPTTSSLQLGIVSNIHFHYLGKLWASSHSYMTVVPTRKLVFGLFVSVYTAI